MRPNSPCYNCRDRQEGCHMKCAGYAEYKEKLFSYNSELYNKDDQRAVEYAIDKALKLKKKRGK